MRLQLQLILTACIESVQLYKQEIHNKVNDEREVRKNFQNLFDAVARNNTKKSEIYHGSLKEDVAKEIQVFDLMKEELWISQNRNAARKRKFYEAMNVDENIIAKKREIIDTTEIPMVGEVDVNSLGHNGTWNDFCDASRIAKDFAAFSDHDVKRLRMLICQLKKENKIDRKALPAFSTYKYCQSIRLTTDRFYKELANKFEEHFSQTVGEIPTSTSVRPTDECFRNSMDTFHEQCMGRQNPCLRMFQSLISSTCVKPGISAQAIGQYLGDVCQGSFITDQINWEPIDMSIVYYID